MQYVTIGKSYFEKAKQDYQDWHWAWVREIMQNSIDAPGSNRIVATVSVLGNDTLVTVENNGKPMTEDELVNKLLALGESGKSFRDGAVGGFGKAKELIMFAHLSWEVRTGTIRVSGSGGAYEIERGLEYKHGTATAVVMEGVQHEEILHQFQKFARWTQWRGEFTVNGARLDTNRKKGSFRRDLRSGSVYTNKSEPGKLCVRVHGIPMFVSNISFDRTVILELSGDHYRKLTANRDSLAYPYNSELSDFIVGLAVDRSNTIDGKPKSERIVYTNPPLQYTSKKDRGKTLAEVFASEPNMAAYGYDPGVNAAECTSTLKCDVSRIPHNFIIRSDLGMNIPRCYDPCHPMFSKYAMKLARTWSNIMLKLHELFDKSASFSTGFVFSSNAIAMHEDSNDGTVYYVNPCEVVKQQYSSSRSLKRRWKFVGEQKYKLIAAAAHEFVHGLGYKWHDTDFSSKLTDVMGTIMANIGMFHECFR